jgi:FHS family L-fucose permease-like MFS transporter
MVTPTSAPVAAGHAAPDPGGRTSTGALSMITLLFFMWGLLTSLNDVLIPHLKAVYELSYVQAMLVQSCFFAAYFLVSLPAGYLIRRIGYQRGIVVGLAIAAGGCALFYPAAESGYGVFLTALFILASGITILQVAANPYVTTLGPASTASSRLTLTQAFNSLGTTVAPALGGMLILPAVVLTAQEQMAMPAAVRATYKAAEAASVQLPYLGLAATLLLLAGVFALVRLPAVAAEAPAVLLADGSNRVLPPHLYLGIIAIFLYVGGEVAIGSFLINFLGSDSVAAMSVGEAAHYVSFYWGGAMLGRFVGSAVMQRVSPGKALASSAAGACMLIVVAMVTQGKVAMWSILAVGLCNAIMFPTIFSMALHRLGPLTGKGSGLLCMAIVGGAVVPPLQGLLADWLGVQLSFVLPAVCYAFVLWYGLRFARLTALA